MKKIILVILVEIAGIRPFWSQGPVEYLDTRMEKIEAGVPYSYLREIQAIEDGKYHVVIRYRSGSPQMDGYYSDEALHLEDGLFRYYYANGKPESEGSYSQGFKIGVWKRWDWEGHPKADRYYPDEIPIPLAGDMIPAEFPGGDESLTVYVEDHLQYPEEAMRTASSGTVYVAFRISSEGYISQAETVQGANFFLDREACRIVNAMPRWIPATKNGIQIDSQFILPVKFSLPGEAKASASNSPGKQ